ncbi:MAG TPA: DNA polymerase III subunit gamma/tau [Firmicutes bacterium]|nr:DNA polymerase III subunit gamma/tau [Bacillota bacterium]
MGVDRLKRHVTLYREARPQRFQDVVGQTHVVRTLRNGVLMGRIAHAYLFAGPRGTGKTSVARILARALNCSNPSHGEPCNQCSSCREILAGVSGDVLEIDAASNRGINEIRELREESSFAPATGKYRVYIVDEVHMLTKEAFNALLKTLEEPPSHVVFILATTEVYRVPPTVVSRCQRFDFFKIPEEQIASRIMEVASSHDIQVDQAAARLIARLSDGSLRDALGLLDQASSSGARVTEELIRDITGMGSRLELDELASDILQGDMGGSLDRLKGILGSGVDPRLLLEDLAENLRERLESSKGLRGEMERILRALDVLYEASSVMRHFSRTKVVVEAAVARACLETTGGDEPALDRVAMDDKALKPKQTALHSASRTPKQVESAVARTPEEVKVEECWPRVLETLRKNKQMRVRALLLPGKPLGVDGGNFIVAFSPESTFHVEQLKIAQNKAEAEKAIAQVMGKALSLQIEVTEKLREEKGAQGTEDVLEQPFVKRSLEMLGGEILEVRKEDDG